MVGQAVDSIEGGVQDATGSPATSKTSANTRVKTASGAIGIMTDVLSFSGTTVSGIWTLGALRCRINGIPAIHQASIGIGIASATPPGTTGPLQIVQADSKVKVL